MMRRNLLIAAVVATLATLACAAPPQPQAATKPAAKTWDQALEQVQPKMEFPGIPLEQVIEFIRDAGNPNIVVDWPALETAGLNKETPVNLSHLQNVPLRTILDSILAQVGGVNPLEYVVKDDVLIISTREKLVVTRIYNVTDLIDAGDPEQVCSLMDIIRANIEKGTWGDGQFGQIRSLNGVLIVTTTPLIQLQVQKLLEALGKEHPKVTPSPAAQVKQAEMRVKVVGSMKDTCFDSQAFGIIALGGLQNEVPQKPEDFARQLEGMLPSTYSQGLRNAIRLTLKDLYLEMKAPEKAQSQLKQMLIENDDWLARTHPEQVSSFATTHPAAK